MSTLHAPARFQYGLATFSLIAIACLLNSEAQAQPPSIVVPQRPIGTLQAQVATLQSQVAALQALVASLQSQVAGGTIPNVGGYVTMDLSNPSRPTLRVAGANLQVVNGLGQTVSQPNGLGNVIVGYDESSWVFPPVCSLGQFKNETSCVNGGGTWAASHKSGSHNLVIGPYHRYSRSGGLIAGFNNTVNGDYSSVTSGMFNTVSGDLSSISGGYQNTASGPQTSVSGGYNNIASGGESSISGGGNNTTFGYTSSISGGESNTATDNFASVSGGDGNLASGNSASVSGGQHNTASGPHATVSGGNTEIASSPYEWVGGTLHSP